MVGHRKELPVDAFDIGNAIVREIMGRRRQHPFHSLVHHQDLELVNASYTFEYRSEELRLFIRKNRLGNFQHCRMIR